MSIFVSIYAAFLFFILTPSILLRIPPKGDKYLVAFIHALLFAIILYLTHTIFARYYEGFDIQDKLKEAEKKAAGVVQKVGNVAQQVGNNSVGAAQKVGNAAQQAGNNAVGAVQKVGNAAQQVGNNAVGAVQKVGNAAQQVGNNAVGAVQQLGNTAQQAGNNVGAAQKIGNAAQQAGNNAVGVAQKVGNVAQQAGNNAVGAVQKVGNAAQQVGNNVVGAAQKVGNAAQQVGNTAQQVENALKQNPPTYQLINNSSSLNPQKLAQNIPMQNSILYPGNMSPYAGIISPSLSPSLTPSLSPSLTPSHPISTSPIPHDNSTLMPNNTIPHTFLLKELSLSSNEIMKMLDHSKIHVSIDINGKDIIKTHNKSHKNSSSPSNTPFINTPSLTPFINTPSLTPFINTPSPTPIIITSSPTIKSIPNKWPMLVGKPLNFAQEVILKDRPNIKIIFLNDSIPVTKDIDYNRVRIFINNYGIVSRVPVVG